MKFLKSDTVAVTPFHIMARIFLFILCFLIPAQIALAQPAPYTLSLQGQGTAPPPAPDSCDPQYWKALEERAWQEAEREIIQNQNLIFKPDSVLEYTCFDSFLNVNATYAAPLFVEYPGWPNLGAGAMANALTALVKVPMEAYLEAAFQHTFLGDRFDYASVVPGPVTGGSDYVCDAMNQVWRQAKCWNFIDAANRDEASDGFYPLQTIEGAGGPIYGYNDRADPRMYPKTMTRCDGPGPLRTPGAYGINQFGTSEEFLQTNNRNTFADPTGDVYDAVRLRLEPGGCTGANNAAIMTGVEVFLAPGSNIAPYDDGVCPNPGCSFQRDGTCAP